MKKVLLISVLVVTVAYFARQWYRGPSIVTPTDRLFSTYDYVVVGAGTAGCVLAARLTELPNVTILVLEAGHDDYDFPYTQWQSMEQNLQYTDFDWHYKTVPQEKCCDGMVGKVSKWPRGKGLGGCSSHFGAVHVRGSRFDYDLWERELGPESGWGFKDVLSYFKKIENVTNVERLIGKTELHGFDGPVPLTDPGLRPLAASLVEVAKKMGYAWRDDVNSMGGKEDQEGFSSLQRAVLHGRRMSAAETYLRPAARQHPERLHILTKARVTRLLVDDSDKEYQPLITGVEYLHDGVITRVSAIREVILSAGAINSPQILMLSGIGPRKELEKHGVEIFVDNEAVGRNLFDHVWVPFAATVNDTTVSYNRVDPSDWFNFGLAMAQYYLLGTGSLAESGIELAGFFRSGLTNETWPDLQLYLIGTEITAPHDVFNWNEKASKSLYPDPASPERKRVGLLPILLHPHNSGDIRLRSADPFDYPLIDPKYLDNDLDVDILVRGAKMALKFAQSPELKKYDFQLTRRHAPGCEDLELWSDEYLKCHVRSMLLTIYHPVGTCRMGKEGVNSVVDTKLSVHGVDHLRVVDASIFPFQISANPNAPTLMVAEKASDMIKADYFHAQEILSRPPTPPPVVAVQPPPVQQVEEYYEDEEEEGQCYHPEDEEEEEGEDEEHEDAEGAEGDVGGAMDVHAGDEDQEQSVDQIRGSDRSDQPSVDSKR